MYKYKFVLDHYIGNAEDNLNDVLHFEMQRANGEQIGWITFEFRRITRYTLSQRYVDAVEKMTENNLNIIAHISLLKINREYRYKGYGTILMRKFLEETILMEFPEIDLVTCFPDVIDNDTELTEYQYLEMLNHFYRGLGFNPLLYGQDTLVKRL